MKNTQTEYSPCSFFLNPQPTPNILQNSLKRVQSEIDRLEGERNKWKGTYKNWQETSKTYVTYEWFKKNKERMIEKIDQVLSQLHNNLQDLQQILPDVGNTQSIEVGRARDCQG